jgi:hypothetical protein
VADFVHGVVDRTCCDRFVSSIVNVGPYLEDPAGFGLANTHARAELSFKLAAFEDEDKALPYEGLLGRR